MRSSTFQKLSFVFLISSTVPASSALSTAVLAARSVGLLSRDSQTCGGISSLSQCSNNLPNDFCCPTGSSCLQLNNTAATSVICCPSGSDCKLIKPVTCDVSRLNATLYPTNLIHSTDLNINLPTCGDACCPLGYECKDGQCSMLASTSEASTATPSASASAPSTPVPLPTQFATPTPTPTALPVVDGPSQGNGFSGRSFAAGFVPGIVLGALLLYGLLWALKQRRKRKNRYSGDFGPVSYNVSDPIYNPILSARTDFLRRPSANNGTQRDASPASSLGTATLLGTGGSRSAARPPAVMTERFGKATSRIFRSPKIPQDPYQTPTRQPVRAPSTLSKASTPSKRGKQRDNGERPSTLNRSDSKETIDVLMPAPSFLLAPPPALRAENGRPLTSDTTFTSLMAHAGFSRDSQDGVRKMSARLNDKMRNV